MRISLVFLLAAVTLSGFRCSLPWGNNQVSELSIVSYNAHNLFDDIEDGGEYPEFKLDSGKWNTHLYEKRLEAVATAVCSFPSEGREMPDIICLQEIESAKILRDLARGPLKKGGYSWGILGGPGASAIKCGILSRQKPESTRAHALADMGEFGLARDILEATFCFGAEGPRLTIFVCHWKSRKEGEEATEVVRRAASKLVAARLLEVAAGDPGRCVLVCGDFNESPDELSRVGYRYPTAFMPATGVREKAPEAWSNGVIRVASTAGDARVSESEVTLYSPWMGAEGFSYIYDGEEERLDGFLLGPTLVDGEGMEFSSFMVSEDPALLDEKGEPLKWTGSSGFSDHLPIRLKLNIDVAHRR